MKTTSYKSKRLLGTVALIVITILSSGCGLFNNDPFINSLQSQDTLVENLHISEVECVAFDPDNDALEYQWTVTGGQILGEGPIIDWRAPDTPGSYNIAVVVTDGKGGEAEMELAIIVFVNQRPVIESLVADPSNLQMNESTTIECIAYDPDGDELTYDWSASGGEISGQGTTITWTAPDTEDIYRISVIVTDDRGSTASQEVLIRVGDAGCG